jgi:hypothetical protein
MSDEPTLGHDVLATRQLGLRRLVWALLGLIAATFIFMGWVLGQLNSHDENQAARGPSAVWPDGSAKTSNDWWAKAGGQPPAQVAQPPAGANPPGNSKSG